MMKFSHVVRRASLSSFSMASRPPPASSWARGGRAISGADLPAGVEVDDVVEETRPPPPGPLDHLFAESTVGWRADSGVPDRLVRGVRQLLRKHNVKRINDDFDALEHRRLNFSLRALNTSKWFGRDLSDRDNDNDMGGPVAPLVYGPKESIAYTARRVVPAFSALSRVFTEVKRRRPNFEPTSLLDFGSGPAPSIWSANSVWPNTLGFGTGDFSLIEPSRSMSELGRDLLNTKRKKKKDSGEGGDNNVSNSGGIFDGRFGGETNTRIRRWDTLREFVAHSPSSTEIDDVENASTRLQVHHLHDIVLASYVISELGNDSSRDAALRFCGTSQHQVGCWFCLSVGINGAPM